MYRFLETKAKFSKQLFTEIQSSVKGKRRTSHNTAADAAIVYVTTRQSVFVEALV